MSHYRVRPSFAQLRFVKWGLLAWLATLVWAASVLASPAVLVTVHSVDAADPAPYELRLRSELAAEGLDAFVANPSSIGDNPKLAAARFGANALVEVSVSTSEIVAVVWVTDPSLGLEVTRNLRVPGQQRDNVAVFALRTVDFLQGARLELEQQRRVRLGAVNAQPGGANAPAAAATQTDQAEQPKPTPAHALVPREKRLAARVTEPKPEPPAARSPMQDEFRLSLGGVLILPTYGFTWSAAPALSMLWYGQSNWGVGITALGPSVNHIYNHTAGYSVTVEQEFLALQLRRRIALSRVFNFEPYIAIGGSRYTATGDVADSSLVGQSATAWSLLNQAGATVAGHLGAHWHVLGDASVLLRWQVPQVWVASRNLTGKSAWNLLFGLGIGRSF